jgi:hypothetical protein
MKPLKLLFTLITSLVLFNSCVLLEDDYIDETGLSLEQVVSEYDLWYVDYHRTSGNGDIPYLSKAFTVSFINGILYANNNIVDIGRTGNGLGINVGAYNTYNGLLETNHVLDGANDFEVSVLSNNEIRLYNYRENVYYYLIGYQINEFDYDKLFYENIEYFLQEYIAWEKVTTADGIPNEFDNENYLGFTPENITTFYSSQDSFGTNIDLIDWSFIGGYEIYDVSGYDYLKILTLNYDGGDVEEFELTVMDDDRISLYHIDSETTYIFLGRGFIQYLKGGKVKKEAKEIVRNESRKRTKVKRKIKTRRNLK